MIRYTTPTINLSFQELDMSQVDVLRVVFKQDGRNGFVKVYDSSAADNSDITIENGVAEVRLTTTETGSFKSGKVQVQGHIKLTDGTVLATNAVTLPVVDNLDEDTMEDD